MFRTWKSTWLFSNLSIFILLKSGEFLQPCSFDLVGSILYEVNEQQFHSIFYNGTFVVEVDAIFSVETNF
jgi:hypothetical protein